MIIKWNTSPMMMKHSNASVLPALCLPEMPADDKTSRLLILAEVIMSHNCSPG